MLLAGVVNPWVFIPTAPLVVAFLYLRRYYLRTSRDIKRLEATSKIYCYASILLPGMNGVLAYCHTAILILKVKTLGITDSCKTQIMFLPLEY